MFYQENAQEVIWHYVKIKWKFNKENVSMCCMKYLLLLYKTKNSIVLITLNSVSSFQCRSCPASRKWSAVWFWLTCWHWWQWRKIIRSYRQAKVDSWGDSRITTCKSTKIFYDFCIWTWFSWHTQLQKLGQCLCGPCLPWKEIQKISQWLIDYTINLNFLECN